MKKTNKILSVLLAVVMLFSAMSVSLIASAAGEDSEKQMINATYVLDMADKFLDEKDLNSQINLPSGLVSVLKLMGITIKLNSVNEITETLNGVAKSRLVNSLLNLMGDLKDLNLSVWKTKYTRGSDAKDSAIIAALVVFVKDNTTIIQKFLEGNLDIGLAGEIEISGKKLNDTINGALGEGGVCAMLKGMIAGLVYEKDSAEYNACVAKPLDKMIFEDLATVGIDKLLKMADDAILSNYVNVENPVEPLAYLYNDLGFKLVGSFENFTYDSSKSVDGFLADVANAIYKKVQTPLNQMVAKYGAELNKMLAESGAYGAPFAKLYDFTKLNFEDFTSTSIVDINVFVGKLIKQISAFNWDDKANLGDNIQNFFMWSIQNRDKTVEGDPYTTVSGSNFAEYALTLAKMIVSNTVTGEDRDTVVAKMNSCSNATEVLTILLPYLLNRGDATVVAATSKTYEQVLGDIVGYYTQGILPIAWTPSTSVWDVANEIVNYFLVGWNVDGLFGLNLSTSESFFSKLDKLQAAFMGDVEYVKASTYIPALLKNILALDLSAFFKEGFEDAFVNKNTDLPAALIVCKIVNNIYKSVVNADIFKFNFTSATTKADGSVTITCNLDGNVVATAKTSDKVNATVKLSKTSYTYSGKAAKPTVTVTDVKGKVLVNGKDYTVAYKDNVNAGTASAVVTLKGDYSGTLTAKYKITALDASKYSVKLSKTSYTYTGKSIKVTATVKNGSKTLTEGKDYTISYKNNKNVGTATATIVYKGNYKGKSAKLTFKILPKQVTGLKASSIKTTSLKLTWSKVTGAKYYKVEMSTNGKKWKTVNIVSKNSLTVTKLKAGTKYQFRVTAIDSTKKLAGKASSVLKTGTLTGAPSVTLKSSKSKTATASWKKVTGAAKYVVYKSTNGKKWTKVTTTTKTSYTITKLTGGKKVYVKVAALNAYGAASAYSSAKKVTVKK